MVSWCFDKRRVYCLSCYLILVVSSALCFLSFYSSGIGNVPEFNEESLREAVLSGHYQFVLFLSIAIAVPMSLDLLTESVHAFQDGGSKVCYWLARVSLLTSVTLPSTLLVIPSVFSDRAGSGYLSVEAMKRISFTGSLIAFISQQRARKFDDKDIRIDKRSAYSKEIWQGRLAVALLLDYSIAQLCFLYGYHYDLQGSDTECVTVAGIVILSISFLQLIHLIFFWGQASIVRTCNLLISSLKCCTKIQRIETLPLYVGPDIVPGTPSAQVLEGFSSRQVAVSGENTDGGCVTVYFAVLIVHPIGFSIICSAYDNINYLHSSPEAISALLYFQMVLTMLVIIVPGRLVASRSFSMEVLKESHAYIRNVTYGVRHPLSKMMMGLYALREKLIATFPQPSNQEATVYFAGGYDRVSSDSQMEDGRLLLSRDARGFVGEEKGCASERRHSRGGSERNKYISSRDGVYIGNREEGRIGCREGSCVFIGNREGSRIGSREGSCVFTCTVPATSADEISKATTMDPSTDLRDQEAIAVTPRPPFQSSPSRTVLVSPRTGHVTTDSLGSSRTPISASPRSSRNAGSTRDLGSIPEAAFQTEYYMSSVFASLSEVEANCDATIGKLNDIVILDSLDSGLVALELEACHPSVFFNGIAKRFEKRAISKDIALSITFDTKLDEHNIHIDPPQMLRAFENILSNALKFTPEGGRIKIAFHIETVNHSKRGNKVTPFGSKLKNVISWIGATSLRNNMITPAESRKGDTLALPPSHNTRNTHIEILPLTTHSNSQGLPNGDYLSVDIKDTGCGLTPSDLDYMSLKNRNCRSSRRGSVQSISPNVGTAKKMGLGLPISQGIFRLHHGTISYQCHGEGRGTTFSCFLPLHSVHAVIPEPNVSVESRESRREVRHHWLNNPDQGLRQCASASEYLGWFVPDYLSTGSGRAVPPVERSVQSSAASGRLIGSRKGPRSSMDFMESGRGLDCKGQLMPGQSDPTLDVSSMINSITGNYMRELDGEALGAKRSSSDSRSNLESDSILVRGGVGSQYGSRRLQADILSPFVEVEVSCGPMDTRRPSNSNNTDETEKDGLTNADRLSIIGRRGLAVRSIKTKNSASALEEVP